MGKTTWEPGQERLPAVPDSQLTEAQRAAIDGVVKGPRGGFGGPFVALVRSPEFLDRFQRVGEYLRFGSELDPKLRELAILVCIREWEQPHEFAAHAAQGRKEGLSETIMRAVADKRRPDGSEAELAVYDFCIEVMKDHAVSDANYDRLLRAVGDKGLVDILGLLGYYVGVAIVLNVARPDLPAGVAPYTL